MISYRGKVAGLLAAGALAAAQPVSAGVIYGADGSIRFDNKAQIETTSEVTEYTGPVYIVQRGDNLTRIARMHDMALETLLRYNPELMANPHLIHQGQKIKLAEKEPSKFGRGQGIWEWE